jgi:hypothetical protein
MYTGSGGISLCPVAAARVTSIEVCSRGYKRAREGRSPKFLVNALSGVELLSNGLRALEMTSKSSPLPQLGRPAFPFIDQGKDVGLHE